MHILFTLFNKKTPLKWVYKETTYTFFYETLKSKFNFRNLKILKRGMPQKITPKSQAKNKTLFPQYPFLTIF